MTYPEKLKFDPRPTTEREISESQKQSFLSGVHITLPKATLNISFSLSPPSLEDIAQEVNSCSDNSNVNNLLASKLLFNDCQIHELEKATRNQSNSQIWRLQTKGQVTASRFHEVDKKMQVIYRNRLKPVKCRVTPLLVSIVEPIELTNIESIEWGKTNEKYAAENFMKIEGKKHQNPKLLTCVLYLFKTYPYLGATPDNILKCGCCPKSCMEYKCPHKMRNESIAESW